MKQLTQTLIDEIATVVIGKEHQLRLCVSCLLAGGHLLLEDLPGVGKTTLAASLARVMGLNFNRLQFTSDLLPSDIVGVSIFQPDSSDFRFHPGPVFTQVLLADEINRTTPKTQSALLEAMAENQVTVDGSTYPLPAPFFVIATQNPVSQSGTFPLPESQLDRFLMKIELGYPSPAAEMEILREGDLSARVEQLRALVTPEQLLQWRADIDQIHASESLLSYVQRLVQASRDSEDILFGLSTRGALALLRSGRAWAFLQGRGHVTPEDIQLVFPAVAAHRLMGAVSSLDGRMLAKQLLNKVDVV